MSEPFDRRYSRHEEKIMRNYVPVRKAALKVYLMAMNLFAVYAFVGFMVMNKVFGMSISAPIFAVLYNPLTAIAVVAGVFLTNYLMRLPLTNEDKPKEVPRNEET